MDDTITRQYPVSTTPPPPTPEGAPPTASVHLCLSAQLLVVAAFPGHPRACPASYTLDGVPYTLQGVRRWVAANDGTPASVALYLPSEVSALTPLMPYLPVSTFIPWRTLW